MSIHNAKTKSDDRILSNTSITLHIHGRNYSMLNYYPILLQHTFVQSEMENVMTRSSEMHPSAQPALQSNRCVI